MALLRLLTLVTLLGGEVSEGFAPHYAQGLMGKVAARRDLPLVGCMVSSPVYPIGTWLYIYGKNTRSLHYCRVTDVSGPKDRARHIRTKRVVEIAYENVMDVCGGFGRAIDCPVLVIRVNE